MSKYKAWSFLFSFFIIASLLFSQQLLAQPQQAAVPTEQEPHHRIVFQNKNVRIYDALIPPGDVTLFHTHSFDAVNVIISGGKAINESLGKPPIETTLIAGGVSFYRATNALFTHRLSNIGTTPIRVLGVEILASPASGGVPAALGAVPGHKLALENDRVKVYRVFLDPNQSTGLRSRNLPWICISLTQGMISIHEKGKSPENLSIKPGDFRWYGDPTTDSIENVGSTKYDQIEIELK